MTPIAATAFVWVFILVPLLIVWALGIVDIVRRDMPRSSKAGWILIVVLLPVVGTITYFVMRKPTETEVRRSMQARAERRQELAEGPGRDGLRDNDLGGLDDDRSAPACRARPRRRSSTRIGRKPASSGIAASVR